MSNKRIRLTEQDILSKVRLPLMPGDIVTKNIYFPASNRAEHFKILSVYDLEIPYKDGTQPPQRRTWANAEIVRSPDTPAAVGIQLTDPIHVFRRIEERTVADYIAEKGEK